MDRRFTRRQEDFTCLQCGLDVQGDGYSNHCPRCLWSRHVDRNPGDRAEGCGGAMRPIAVEFGADRAVLTHACERCGNWRRCRTSPTDDGDALFAVAATAAAEAARTGQLTGPPPPSSSDARGPRRATPVHPAHPRPRKRRHKK
ncbi:RNHCP domain-containing protein [Frankia sp. R82]|uniref:RNHCP domain-containing protein n=1 Tax=Frankia sp. R82 TaxID=2950553 RepID=UPI002042DB30|nr:RNHCP domain-containing protein [Frankia sp. R82]MCM3886400.1 RNHCP domain-containing protein [Frankia sp. R82]